MPSAQLRQNPDSARPADGGADVGRVDVRKTLTSAALVAGLGGMLAVTQASQETAPELVPVVHVQQGEPASMRLAALHARAEAHELQYEPSKREREGDDDDEDEPRR